ncbi:hypothetical protein [Sabulicella rubraurantiaca]|uniref:hypothetical protein n=1 Tax=Sabulicella rubraurantiaca TaxID=2811429 RepID=UPI001A96D9C6|nr:hypothetical protein [Sabulicella rubraurantiaca]
MLMEAVRVISDWEQGTEDAVTLAIALLKVLFANAAAVPGAAPEEASGARQDAPPPDGFRLPLP